MCDTRLRRRSALGRQDLREPIDVELVEDAASLRLLQAGDELRAQDVDLAVEQPAAVRDLLLLLREVVDQLLEVVVGERGEGRKGFHRRLSSGGQTHSSSSA